MFLMTKQKRILFMSVSISFEQNNYGKEDTNQVPFRVIRVRVSPPESEMVIKSQPETMRASQSHSVSIANGLND
jgi:hypothetical protein